MNRRALLIALIVSAIVSLAMWARIQNSQKEAVKRAGEAAAAAQKKVVVPKKEVVVCKSKLSARTRMDEQVLRESFEIRNIEESLIPEGAFTSVASMTNRYTAVTILPGDIMTAMRVLKEEQVPSLALAIPQGKRAVTITVSEATSVGGFIQQGDYVDIIASIHPKGNELTSKIILQDIQILAVGTTYEFDGSVATSTPSISANKATLITLALTPAETEKLMYLDTGLNFRLILKNPNDHGVIADTTGITEQQLLNETPEFAETIADTKEEEEEEEEQQEKIRKRLDDGSVIVSQGIHSRIIYRYNGINDISDYDSNSRSLQTYTEGQVIR